MGLDVYVGGLARYFLRDWQLEMETLAEQGFLPEGKHIAEIKTGNRDFAPETWAEATPQVDGWWRRLAEDFGKEAFLDWTEAPDAPWFTRKITWECYSALLLWAAHEEHLEAPMPSTVPDDFANTAVALSQSNIRSSRYPHLLDSTTVWLPVEDGRTFRAPDPGGYKRDFGFLLPLAAELVELNERTWEASIDEVNTWWKAGPPEHRSPLVGCAQFGFSVLRVLVATAHRNGLPMVLDP